MCGLFGAISSSLTTSEVEVVNILGVLSSYRGYKSVGVCVASRDKKKLKVNIEKSLDDPMDFFRYPEVRKMMAGKGRVPCMIMGHTREPTAGEVVLENAQPVKTNSWVTTHNGRIPSLCHPAVAQTGKIILSDSVLATDDIYRFGLKRAIEGRYSESGASTALVAYNTNDRRIRFYRNHARPLWFMFSPDNNTLYWASEREALEFAVNRSVDNAKRKVAFQLPANSLLTLPVGQAISPSDIKYEDIGQKHSTPIQSALMPERPAEPPGRTAAELKAEVIRLGTKHLREDLAKGLEKGGAIEVPNTFHAIERSSLPAGPSVPLRKPTTLIERLDAEPQLITEVAKPGFNDPYRLVQGVVTGFIGPMGVILSYDEAAEFFSGHECSCCNHKADPEKEEVVWWPGWDGLYPGPELVDVLSLEYLCEDCASDETMYKHLFSDSVPLHQEGSFTIGRPIVDEIYTSH